ncbi:MAG TPA: hypothetical protein VGN90_14815 [Pyrinomonadaceae bacterium]|nr:hypothetical protein [Pyrinomonadaceae bacterium]
MSLKKLSITLALFISFVGSAYAQLSPATTSEHGLALEVVFLKGRPPTYQTIGSRSKQGGAWYGLFGRIEGWQLPKDALPINAVRLVPYLKGETVNVNVSVLRGQFLDTESKVAWYQAAENEAITVKELEAFGVEPFVIKVVRSSADSDLPATLSKPKSVAIVGLEPIAATLPRYKLTLHNLSSKNISALSIKVMNQGRTRLTSMPQGDYGEPLIKVNESAGIKAPLAVNAAATSEGFEASPAQAQQIVVASLIFADGSYEGELQPAGNFLAFVIGRRIELRRILPLLNEALSGADAASASDKLRAQLTALSYEADASEVASLLAAFPSLEKRELESSVDVAIHGTRKGLLDQLRRVEKAEANATAFSRWLASTRQLYSKWLANLDAINVAQGRSQ